MENERYVLSKGSGRRTAWVVEDKAGPKAEDPILHFFSSRAKARQFLADMVAEHGNSVISANA